MEEIRTVGLDIARSSFQVHAINAIDEVVVRRKLRIPLRAACTCRILAGAGMDRQASPS
jgi:hypothetical protein